MTEIDELKVKLAARKGKGGYAQNVREIEARIAYLESLTFTYRDKETGKFVSAEYALANPDTTRQVEAA